MRNLLLFLLLINIVLCNGLINDTNQKPNKFLTSKIDESIETFSTNEIHFRHPRYNNFLTRSKSNPKIIRFGAEEVNMTPVVFMHGLFSSYKDAYGLMEVLIEDHPGQPIYFLDINNNLNSFKSLKIQIQEIQELIRYIIKEHSYEFKKGFHFVGHSQGGLLSRSVIEESTDFIIKNYISLAGIQNGEYGNCQYLVPFIDCSQASYILYSKIFRDSLSVAQFWRDVNYSYYLEWNQFLPYINNEIETNETLKRKKNFMGIENVYLYASPADELIAPWQSSHFGFYDEYNQTIIPMKEQLIYKKDLFGLKSLGERLHLIEIPNVKHGEWIRNKELIRKYILDKLI